MTKYKPKNKNSRINAKINPREQFIYGRHAVRAAMTNPHRKLHHLYTNTNAATALTPLAQKLRLTHDIITNEKLNQLIPETSVHQGVVLNADPLPPIDIKTACNTQKTLLILDQITDPRNIGAILRNAAVFNAGGIVITRNHCPPRSGAMAKTASGALEYVPFVEVGNLARSIDTIKQHGYYVIGLDETAQTHINQTPRDQPIACILGSEERGLRQLTQKHCDRLIRLTHASKNNTSDAGEFATLNVSSAAAIALFNLRVPC